MNIALRTALYHRIQKVAEKENRSITNMLEIIVEKYLAMIGESRVKEVASDEARASGAGRD